MDLIKVKKRIIPPNVYDQLRKDIESYEDVSITTKNVFATKEFVEFLAENYACFDSEPLEAILNLHTEHPLNIMKVDFEYEDKFCIYINAILDFGKEYRWTAN